MFTFGQWVILVCIVFVFLFLVLLVGLMTESLRASIVSFVVCCIITVLIGFGILTGGTSLRQAELETIKITSLN